MFNVGLIGFGYWGPNLARNVHAHPHLNLWGIADKDRSKLKKAKELYGQVNIFEEANALIINPNIQVVIIATSVEYHYSLARYALENKKHVLVEKPAGTSYEQLYDLHKVAKDVNRVLMIDYTFLYNGAVRKLKELIDNGKLGNINYIDSVRINLGIFQSEVNVVWDLASHDVAIINFLLEELPESVRADGISHTLNEIENIAYITMRYKNNKIVHINCSWTSPVKIRQMLVGGEKKMVVYNDIEPTDKIKVYDSSLGFENKEQAMVDYRVGELVIPKFDTGEPLSVMIDDLYLSIYIGKKPQVSSEEGLKVSLILEAIQVSLKQGGKEINLNDYWRKANMRLITKV